MGNAVVTTSPERRARETAALAFPSAVARIRDQLREVERPWYASGDEQAAAVADYLQGTRPPGWEPREDVLSRIAPLKAAAEDSGSLVLVSHGVLLTTWIDHETGLSDPLAFWSALRMPDAWELDFEHGTVRRVLE